MLVMSRIISVIAIAAVLAAGVCAQISSTNQVEAIVNDRVVTRFDVMEKFKEANIDLSELPKSEAKVLFQRQLDDMVLKILQDLAAEKSGIALRPEDIENSLNRKKEQFGGEEAFSKFLQDQGLSQRRYIEDFRRQQETAAWLRVVSGSGGGVKSLGRELRPLFDLTVTPRELRSYYVSRKDDEFTTKNQAKVRVVQKYFRRSNRRDRRTQKQLVQSIKFKVRDTKADFAVLAAKNSEHPSAEKGGALDPLEPQSDILPEPIMEAIFDPKNRQPGTLIGPIENVNAWWLIEVLEVTEAKTTPFKEAVPLIRSSIQRIKWNRALRGVLLDLVESSYVSPERLKSRLVTQLSQMKG
jgi:parvulin-like peptidyl-prolyl isomerase